MTQYKYKMKTVTYTKLFDEYNKCWTGTITLNESNNLCTFGNLQCEITDTNRLCIKNKFENTVERDYEIWIFGIFGIENKTEITKTNDLIHTHTKKFVWE